LIRNCYIALTLIFLANSAQAQFGNIEFIENKGQWDSKIKFKSDIPAGTFLIHKNGFTVVQHQEDDLKRLGELAHGTMEKGKDLIVRSHAYSVEFAGASPDFEIVPDKPQTYYNNYFIGNDETKWTSNCKIYQGVTLKNVYPDTDIRYYTEGGTMKYDIVLKPGADLSRIVLKYSGADKLEVKNKELVVKTSIGDIRELDPFTYQYENNQRRSVACKYILTGNEVRFDVKNYNPKETLIIDPTLIFCSFTGSTGSNWGFTATYGPDGSFYSGGINLEAGFKTSPGAFQTNFSGGTGNPPSDISIMKLSPDGSTRIYATYIGGNGDEQPHSLVVDGAGNLIIAGRTSSANYPLTGGGLIGSGGGFDIVVTKLNATGTALVGSKKIGGSGDDGVNISASRNGINSLQQNYGDDGRSEVILDFSGNIYVASCTRSGNFPATAGAFQTSFAGGSNRQDGVVLKMDPGVSSLQFASYLGGSADDAAYVISLGPNGDLFVAGGTASTDFPGNMAGSVFSSNQGGIDGFVAVISNNGNTLIHSTYLGTTGIDQVYGIQFDRVGYPYVTGQTSGSWPHVVAAFRNTGAPQFIAKLKPDLSAFVYSTTFGRPATTPNISITAFLVDNCENVYVSGWGGEIGENNSYKSSLTTGMPVTPDAIQSTTDGNDFYFFVLKKNATGQLFGSFYGQNGGGTPDHVDGGTSRFDQQGVIYQAVCANCGGGSIFPTTPGVAYPNNGATSTGGCNLAMIKISFDFAGVDAGLQSSINGVPRDTVGCAPLTVDFTDTVANAVTYYWRFGDGTPEVITTTPGTTHTYNLPGFYQVMLIAEDSTSCNIRDTAFIHIRAGNLKANIDFNPVKLAPCDSLKYRFDNLSAAPPARPFTNQSFLWDFGDGSAPVIAGAVPVFHSFSAPGSYKIRMLLLDTAYCNSPDSMVKIISIAPQVVADFTTPPTGCAPYSANFTNTSIAGQNFFWTFGDGGTSTAMNPTHNYLNPGTYTITLIVIDSNTCNISDTTSKSITVYGDPVSAFSFAPVPPEENTPTVFTNLASPDAIRFKWIFGDGDSLVTVSRLPVSHQYNATGTYTACLEVTNIAGCTDTSCQQVDAVIAALVDVPNAFTPNSNDINSKVFVRGFGITKMKFIIWNRWGQKVFESNDQKVGWDGTYKGKLQPMEVYVYTLEAEFFDGTKTTKTGDITLLR
jgi:gliding motility-associated-like protein